MEAIFVLSLIEIPCAMFLVYCMTPKGKQWLQANQLI